MFRLGITGGIGSGKTTVCKAFRVFGIPVFSADKSARELMDNDSDLINELKNIIQQDVYSDGTLDRRKLASLIFNDRELLVKVNKLVHPAVIRSFENWVQERKTAPYVILEAAILFESGADAYTDKSLVVITPFEERIMRVMERNIMTRKQVERMRNQFSENELIKRSDFHVNNSESDMIIPQVIRIHNEIFNIIKNAN